MELFTLIELAAYAPAVVRAVQTPHDVDGLDQPAVFLRGTHQGILSAIALEFADEQ